jgi:hypothetical protein
MKKITKAQAIKTFLQGEEVWVYTSDIENNLMHPKSLDYGDELEDLEGYSNYFV